MKRNENSGGQASMGLSAQTILLVRLKLRNCLGLNEVIHGKDGRKSLRLTGMLVAYLLLGGMMIFYLAAAAFLLCLTGAGESVPAFAALVSGGVIFIFSFLKAGPLLFDAADLERLLPLPLQPVSIIVSRFFILYVEELLFSAAIVLPASLVYLVMERPGAGFLLTTLLALPFQPLLPLTAAAVLGTLVLAAGAGMKHRGAVPVILTLGLSMLVVAGSFALSFTVGMEDPDVGELGGLLEAAVAAGTRFYPPAGLYAAGVTDQSILPLLLFVVLSAGVFAVFSENFCRVDPEKRGKTFSNGRSAPEPGLEGGILSGASPVFFLSHLCVQYPCDLCADAGLCGSAGGDGKRKNRRSDAAA